MTASLSEVFGNGSGSFGLEGNLAAVATATGVSPGATGADNVVAVFSIPANSFDQAGRVLQITASGSFAANGDTKTVKIIINPASAVVGSTVGSGGTTLASTGAVATNGTGYQLQASVIKYGAAGSNTQVGLHNQAQIGAAVASMAVPASLTMAENLPILVAVTANCATTATDVVHNALVVGVSN
jgi:hypothetical protein